MKMKKRSNHLGFLSIVLLWAGISVLCYLGIIAFDSKSLGGSMLSGLIISASMVGALKVLVIFYDEIYSYLTRSQK